MINVNVQFSVPLGRHEPRHYIRALDISIGSWDGDGNELCLGKISGDHILLSDAEIDGESLLEICDDDSQGMLELHTALFDKGYELRPELGLYDATGHVLFYWYAVLHPKLLPYEMAIWEVLSVLLAEGGVVALLRNVTNLTDKQLSELGFSKIAGTNFIVRHTALQTTFGKVNPTGIEVDLDFDPTMDDEAWVLSRWRKEA